MNGGPDRNEIALGQKQIRTWPNSAIREAAKLTNREQEIVVLAAALLDIRPGSPEGRPQDVIEIDWRGWKDE